MCVKNVYCTSLKKKTYLHIKYTKFKTYIHITGEKTNIIINIKHLKVR